jgi:hypothetical protein
MFASIATTLSTFRRTKTPPHPQVMTRIEGLFLVVALLLCTVGLLTV